MNATALDWAARCSARQDLENPTTTSTPNPLREVHGVRRVGRSLVQFVYPVNYMPKPTVFWHLADDPTLDRDGIEAQPPLPPGDAVEQAVPLVEAGVPSSDAKTTLPAGHVELIDVAEVLLQSPPYTRSYTQTGGES